MARFVLSAFADEADVSLAGQIQALQRNGIDHVEMRGVNGRPFVQHTVEEAKEVQKQLEDHGLSLSAVGSPFGKIGIRDAFAPHLEGFKHALELCHVMHCDRMRVFSFYMPKDEDPAQFRGEVIDRLHAMLEAAQDAGVRLAHENEKGIYGDVTERCLDLMGVFKGKLGGIFDPANFLQCGVQPVEAMACLKEHVAWMHIKDVRSDGIITPAGEGDAQMGELLKTLDACYDQTLILSIEPHLALFKGLDALERDELPAFQYKDNHQAFDAAAAGIKRVLTSIGYHEKIEGGKHQWQK